MSKYRPDKRKCTECGWRGSDNSKWQWKMYWCRERALNPTRKEVWKQAEEAYQKMQGESE